MHLEMYVLQVILLLRRIVLISELQRGLDSVRGLLTQAIVVDLFRGLRRKVMPEGPLVGQGYLKDPEKTALEFIVDPPWLLAGLAVKISLEGRVGYTRPATL